MIEPTEGDLARIDLLIETALIAVRGEERLPVYYDNVGQVLLQRPDFPARSASETIREAEAADYRWLEESNAVLERSLRDVGRQAVDVRHELVDVLTGLRRGAELAGILAFAVVVAWLLVKNL